MVVGSPRIASVGIANHLPQRATATRDVPHGTHHFVDKCLTTFAGLRGLGLQRLVVLIYDLEEAVGLVVFTKEQSIELHPLGTSQWRRFHIFCTFDQRDVDILELAVSTTILERREHNNVGLDVDDALDGRIHAATAVGDMSVAHALLYLRYLDILQISNGGDALAESERREQRAMDGGKHRSMLDGRTDYGAVGQAIGQLLSARHEQIRMEHPTFFPRIADDRLGISVVPDNGEQRGILQLQGITIGLW